VLNGRNRPFNTQKKSFRRNIMPYFRKIQEVRDSAELLEELHQDAIRAGKEAEFGKDLLRVYQQSGEVLLPQLWHPPFEGPTDPEKRAHRAKTWKLALLFAFLNSLLFFGLQEWAIPPSSKYGNLIVFSVVPLTAFAATAFFVTAQRKNVFFSLAVLAVLAGLCGYFFYTFSANSNYKYDAFFESLVFLLHLFLLATISVGVGVLGFNSPGLRSFALLKKSIEILVTFVFFIFALVFILQLIMTLGSFLEINSSVLTFEILFSSVGLIPVFAIAAVYDPFAEPENQNWQYGLSKLISNLMRWLLPLTLVGMDIALVCLPFNYWKPYSDWRVLARNILMLSFVLLVLLEATPLRAEDIPVPRQARTRYTILAVAGMSAIVSLYDMSSTITRIVHGGWTFNRLGLIGLNMIMISILGLIIYGILRGGNSRWIEGVHRAYITGTWIFIAWSIYFLIQVPRLLYEVPPYHIVH
jgi:hypothetical protein